jgi:Uma2 family endonuclease
MGARPACEETEMSAAKPSTVESAVPAEIVYPESDGEPMAETGTHVMAMVVLIATLRAYFRRRRDVYVIGNIFLYYREGDPGARKSPDLMVITGVEPGERRSFKIWEERAVPCFIMEVTSKGTADEDLEAKRLLYQELGVREYFLLDPLREYLERPLIGYRLIGGEYEPLAVAGDGGILSQELGLRLVPEGEGLGLYRFKDGQRVPAPAEAIQLLEDARKQADEAQQRAQQAEKRAEQAERHGVDAAERAAQAEKERRDAAERAAQAEKERRDAAERAAQAEKRANDLEAELERLRAMLPPTPPAG